MPLDPFQELDAEDEAESQFQQADFGPFLVSLAAEYEDSSGAVALLDSFVDAVEVCREFTDTDEDGATVEYRFDPLSFRTSATTRSPLA